MEGLGEGMAGAIVAGVVRNGCHLCLALHTGPFYWTPNWSAKLRSDCGRTIRVFSWGMEEGVFVHGLGLVKENLVG